MWQKHCQLRLKWTKKKKGTEWRKAVGLQGFHRMEQRAIRLWTYIILWKREERPWRQFKDHQECQTLSSMVSEGETTSLVSVGSNANPQRGKATPHSFRDGAAISRYGSDTTTHWAQRAEHWTKQDYSQALRPNSLWLAWELLLLSYFQFLPFRMEMSTPTPVPRLCFENMQFVECHSFRAGEHV